ncbi:MAG: signal peptidase I [Actinomycetaceae bacterium]|nr:signal peptidase I [Actinomycetaceae bacterium]
MRKTHRPRHRADVGHVNPVLARLLEWSVVIVIALSLSMVIRTFFFQAFWIPSSSMEDTLQIGDNVAASPLVPLVSGVERGDVVVFQDDLGWLPPYVEKTGFRGFVQDALVFVGLRPASGDQHLVKRVIGVGGDRVTCCEEDGLIRVNGTALNEPYVKGPSSAQVAFDVTVPDGYLWVMGDNRGNSADSRAHPGREFVSESSVVGKVVWVTWPFSHWGNPTDHSPFTSVPEVEK